MEAHFLPQTNKKADRAGGSRRPPDTEEAGTVRIEILDTGPGISEVCETVLVYELQRLIAEILLS